MKILYYFLLFFSFVAQSFCADELFEKVYNHITPDVFERGYIIDIQSYNGITKAFVTYDGGAARVLISSDDGITWAKEFSDKDAFRGEDYLTLGGGIFKHNITVLPLFYGYIYIQKGLGKDYEEVIVPTKEFNFYVDVSNKSLFLASTKAFQKSDDLGKSWETLKTFGTQTILDISVINDSIYAISTGMNDSNYFHVTFDEGKNWLSVRTEYHYRKICFIDSIGWACSAKKTGNGDQARDAIFKTTNYGKIWTKIYDQENIPKFGLRDIDFYDLNNGIAVGYGGKILITKNGGNSWQQEEIKEDEGYDIEFMSSGFSPSGRMLVGATGFGIYRSQVSGSVKEKGINFSLFPNPAGDFITIDLKPSEGFEHSEGSEIYIYNTLGEKVTTPSFLRNATSPKEGNFRIDISGLAKGMYFVKVGSEMAKFVKM